MATVKTPIQLTLDVHPSPAMYQSIIADMKQKTGRSMEEWIKLVAKEGPPAEKERREWLMSKHGLGRNYAWGIAERSVGKVDDGNPETYLKTAVTYVEQMFSGPKVGLRPIYDEWMRKRRSARALHDQTSYHSICLCSIAHPC
jgi:Domain of unknown function (DUF4287)